VSKVSESFMEAGQINEPLVTSPAAALAKYCDEHVCVCVCVCVCLSFCPRAYLRREKLYRSCARMLHDSETWPVKKKNELTLLPVFLCMLPMAVLGPPAR